MPKHVGIPSYYSYHYHCWSIALYLHHPNIIAIGPLITATRYVDNGMIKPSKDI